MYLRSTSTKIAFVGVPGVGKTTLFEFYRERFAKDARFAFVEEAARDYLRKKYNLKKAVYQRSKEIQELILEREKAAHRSGALVIFFDRSVLDSIIWGQNTPRYESWR